MSMFNVAFLMADLYAAQSGPIFSRRSPRRLGNARALPCRRSARMLASLGRHIIRFARVVCLAANVPFHLSFFLMFLRSFSVSIFSFFVWVFRSFSYFVVSTLLLFFVHSFLF
jgi:hypothetical protein